MLNKILISALIVFSNTVIAADFSENSFTSNYTKINQKTSNKTDIDKIQGWLTFYYETTQPYTDRFFMDEIKYDPDEFWVLDNHTHSGCFYQVTEFKGYNYTCISGDFKNYYVFNLNGNYLTGKYCRDPAIKSSYCKDLKNFVTPINGYKGLQVPAVSAASNFIPATGVLELPDLSINNIPWGSVKLQLDLNKGFFSLLESKPRTP